MPETFHKMLGKQYLITSFLWEKAQIANYIKNGYDNDKQILKNNRFLHFTAHIYYRSIIVDLHALFGKASKSNKYSFFHIAKNFKDKLKDGAIEKVETWLNEHSGHFEVIRNLRHHQIAHYDFNQNEAIILNFDNLEIINELYSLAKRIISYYGESTKNIEDGMGFDFERTSDKVNSLERLINKASQS